VNRPTKPAKTIRHAKRLRREMSLPEALLWQHLRGSPGGIRFRNQHPTGAYVVDFFCARANLAIEVDGTWHDLGDRPARDDVRDAWLLNHRIDTVRISASDVLRDPQAVAESIVGLVKERLEQFGKAPPSAVPAATSPSQVDGENQAMTISPSTCDGEVASRSDDGGAL
jgi:very-short-patch-repair endonuclease